MADFVSAPSNYRVLTIVSEGRRFNPCPSHTKDLRRLLLNAPLVSTQHTEMDRGLLDLELETGVAPTPIKNIISKRKISLQVAFLVTQITDFLFETISEIFSFV